MDSVFYDALRKAAIAAIAAVVTVSLVEGAREYRSRRRRSNDFRQLPDANELDFESEESDEPEPVGLQYADDEPCSAPPHPWEAPVSAGAPGLEGWLETGDDPVVPGCVPPADLEPAPQTSVEFAEGSNTPRWPLSTTKDPKLRVSYKDVRGLFHGRYGRHFSATRKSTDKETGVVYRRVHVGVDLFADDGDIVYAMEPGTVLATLPYYKGLGAVYVLNDSGIIVNYGELRMGSWRTYDIAPGVKVTKGQAIAKVGNADDGSHMLHVETYRPETTVEEIRAGDLRWIAGEAPPDNILDPTRYLVLARQATLDGLA